MAIDLNLVQGQLAWAYWVTVLQLEPDRPPNVLLLKTKSSIDFKRDKTYGITMKESNLSQLWPISRCALVSLQTTEDEVYYGRYDSQGTIQSILGFETILRKVTWCEPLE